MSGVWTGSGTTRRWVRPGSRLTNVPGDRERSQRLMAALADTPFWCDNCGSMHPLIEHRDCRDSHPFRTAFRGSV
jgi:hypothetical protein